MKPICTVLLVMTSALFLVACERVPEPIANGPSTAEMAAGPSPEEAKEFVAAAEERLEVLGQHSGRMQWVLQTFITLDTEVLAARAEEQLTAAQVELAAGAARFNNVEGLDYDTRRKLDFLRSAIEVPAPRDAEKTAEQAEIGARLKGMYGRGSYCREDGKCLSLGDLEEIMAHSRDPQELLDAWEGWRTISPPMKDLYARQVELANEAAVELGFDNLGTMWRSGYDMDPADFPGELDRAWEQVRPLYEALHCHVRAKLAEQYGSEIVAPGRPIPAHLLGNMWAQSWANVYDLVAPEAVADSYDLTAILNEKGFNPILMVRTAEAFFTSLGFEKLPDTFWDRSLFVKPADRDVV